MLVHNGITGLAQEVMVTMVLQSVAKPEIMHPLSPLLSVLLFLGRSIIGNAVLDSECVEIRFDPVPRPVLLERQAERFQAQESLADRPLVQPGCLGERPEIGPLVFV
jgi:hypothetical protein